VLLVAVPSARAWLILRAASQYSTQLKKRAFKTGVDDVAGTICLPLPSSAAAARRAICALV